MSRLLVVLALALCLAPALVFGQFGRQGDMFLLHHSQLKAAGAGTFLAQANNFTATPTKLNQTLELGTNYTFIFSADTDWTLHPLVFTSDAVGGLGAAEPQLDKSAPLGPFPNLGNPANNGFTLNFILSTQIGTNPQKTLWIQNPNNAGEGFAFPLVAQAAPFIAPATAAPTADTFIQNNNFGRPGTPYFVHNSLGTAAGAGGFLYVTTTPAASATPAKANITLEGGTNYTFVFPADTNWADHSAFFTSDPVGGLATETLITNVPLGPFPGTAGAGATLAFVVPTAQIGNTIFIVGNRAGEGFSAKIVSQAPPYLAAGAGPAFQDPATFPAPTLPVAAVVPASSTAAKGNGAESNAPLAFASIVALSLALATASKYL